MLSPEAAARKLHDQLLELMTQIVAAATRAGDLDLVSGYHKRALGNFGKLVEMGRGSVPAGLSLNLFNSKCCRRCIFRRTSSLRP